MEYYTPKLFDDFFLNKFPFVYYFVPSFQFFSIPPPNPKGTQKQPEQSQPGSQHSPQNREQVQANNPQPHHKGINRPNFPYLLKAKGLPRPKYSLTKGK